MIDLSGAQRKKFMRISKGWLKELADDHDVEDIVNEAVAKAIETLGDKPADASFEKHCVYHVISLSRGIVMDQKRGDNTQCVPLEAVDEISDIVAGEDEEYENRKEARERVVTEVLKKMESQDATCLTLHYLYGQDWKALAKFFKISRAMVFKRIDKARERFRSIAASMGVTGHRDSVIDVRNAEVSSTLTPKSPAPSIGLLGWYRTEQETSPKVFVDKDGKEIHLSDPKVDLKLRCQRLRQEYQRSRSADASSSTASPHQTVTRS